jgi:hypothetical protein
VEKDFESELNNNSWCKIDLIIVIDL